MEEKPPFLLCIFFSPLRGWSSNLQSQYPLEKFCVFWSESLCKKKAQALASYWLFLFFLCQFLFFLQESQKRGHSNEAILCGWLNQGNFRKIAPRKKRRSLYPRASSIQKGFQWFQNLDRAFKWKKRVKLREVLLISLIELDIERRKQGSDNG